MSDEPGADPLARHSLSAAELKELFAAERAGEPFFAYKDPTGQLCLFATGAVEALTIGRRDELDLSIPWDTEVSGLHAELQNVKGEWTIVDDGLSRNGTYVGGRRVGGRQRLRDGDRIRIGRTVLAYNAGSSSGVQETASASDTSVLQEVTDTQRKVLVALCRPYRDGADFATPATNQQIAEELFLGVDAVKMHLRRLFASFGLTAVPQNEKRARLVEHVLRSGVISRRELD